MLEEIDKNNCLIEVENENYIYNIPSAGIYRTDKDISNIREELKKLPRGLSDKNINDIIDYNRCKKTGLDTLSLILTDQCNLKCKYCYEGSSSISPKYMSFETALKAVDILLDEARADGKRKSINFFGGEPLLNFKVIEKIVTVILESREKENLDIDLSITTNFILMTDRMFDLIDKADITLLVSMDGNKKKHDSQRVFANGSGTYDLLVNKLEKYIPQRPDLFKARATVIPGNMDFKELTNHIRNIGFKTVYFSIEDCFSNHKKNERVLNILDEYDRGYEDYISSVFDKIAAGKKEILFLYYDVLESLWNRNLHFVPCHIGSGYAAVGPCGKVYPCQRLFGSDLAETFPLDALRQDKQLFHTRTVHEKNDCPECWARYLCSGGCPALSIEKDGNDITPDHWRCKIRKIEIKWLLWLFIKLLNTGIDLSELSRN